MKKLALLLLATLMLTGCAGTLIRSQVEKGIEKALPEYIGPAKEYHVDVQGPGMPMMSGAIEHLHIEGNEVELAPGLIVTHLIIDMFDIQADTKTHSIKSVRATDFSAVISQANINKYIRNSANEEVSAAVDLSPGRIVVEVKPKVAGVGLPVPVKISGKPVIAHPDQVDFVADAGSIAHLPVPAAIVNKALKMINPIVDLSKMKFPVTVKSIKIDDRAATVTGAAEFKGAAQTTPP